MINIIYRDSDIIVCIKPSGVLSTDEPGGMPDLLRSCLDLQSDSVFTVHRLDRVVSGLMLFAVNKKSAGILGKEITDGHFNKEYMAVVHGSPESKSGRYDDLLFRDTSKNMTYVVNRMRKGVRDASLEYTVLGADADKSLVKIKLLTGRTHQIRAQFSSRKMPIFGDKKYGASNDQCQIALWSCRLSFYHPITGEKITFYELPPSVFPWISFPDFCIDRNPEEYELPERKYYREVALNEI